MNQPTSNVPATEKKTQGFASMDPVLHRQIASQGGIRAHELGRAHQFTSEEAREAGRKGGRIAAQRRQAMQLKGMK